MTSKADLNYIISSKVTLLINFGFLAMLMFENTF